MDLLDALNPRQKEAVTHGSGPLWLLPVLAAENQGLTYRIAYLINTAVGLIKFSCNFANKAAQEMKEQVSQLVGGIARHLG